jgi:hypothetical protein
MPVFLVIACTTLTPQNLEKEIKNKKSVSAIYSLFSMHARVDLQRRNVDHPPPHNAKVKNERSYASTPSSLYVLKPWTVKILLYLCQF